MLKAGPSQSMVANTKEKKQSMQTFDGQDNLNNSLKVEVVGQSLLASHAAKMIQI